MVKALFISILLIFHPVHVSILSIDYAKEQEAFKVYLRIYYDDFLLDSGLNEDDRNNLNFSVNDQLTEKILSNYIDSRISIAVNEKRLYPKLEDYSLSDNELKFNLLYNSVKKVNVLTVKNSIMTSLYSDQANMIIVKVNDFEKGVKLTPEEPEQTFRIN